ncbi:MAG: VOC family protein [Dehalococcoidia bacterium]|nr:VOC family protein [Dehalococcoidia bacterium]
MDDTVHVRYMVSDVAKSVEFYTSHLGFEVETNFAPAFGSVRRGNLRLLLAGPQSSAGRPMSDGEVPGPGGWNRIHFVVTDLEAEVSRLKSEGCTFRNEMVTGPGGSQVLLLDPSGNIIELFQAAAQA